MRWRERETGSGVEPWHLDAGPGAIGRVRVRTRRQIGGEMSGHSVEGIHTGPELADTEDPRSGAPAAPHPVAGQFPSAVSRDGDGLVGGSEMDDA